MEGSSDTRISNNLKQRRETNENCQTFFEKLKQPQKWAPEREREREGYTTFNSIQQFIAHCQLIHTAILHQSCFLYAPQNPIPSLFPQWLALRPTYWKLSHGDPKSFSILINSWIHLTSLHLTQMLYDTVPRYHLLSWLANEDEYHVISSRMAMKLCVGSFLLSNPPYLHSIFFYLLY